MAKDLELEKNSPETSADKKSDKPEKKGDKDKKAKDSKDSKDKGKKSGKKKGFFKFFKDARSEFKKVVWPTPKETTHNTVVVIIMCGLAAAVVFGLDSLFGLLNGLLFH